ncbi:probable cytochrome P450 6a14 [Anabrus simplex]|uniref:probable cytochrome P450 6a14 n=1 Tax=Anabrus simplex TaxID=316456 RepID=UPI0035A2F94B
MAIFTALWSLEFLATAALSLGLIYWYLTSTFNYWKIKGVPYLKPKLVIGNLEDQILVRLSAGEMNQKFYRHFEGHRFGGIFSFRKPVLILRDPELIKQVLVKSFGSFHDRGLPYDEKVSPLSQHLVNLEGTRWRKLRVKLTPTFTSGKIKMMYNLMKECALELRDFLGEQAKKGEMVEIKEAVAQYTTDVIGTCAFGLQLNSMKDPNSEFRQMGRKVFEPSKLTMIRRMLMNMSIRLARLLNLRSPPKAVSDFFINAVREMVDYREKNNVKRNDFMQLLIQLKNKGRVDDDQTSGNYNESNDIENLQNEKEAEDLVMDDSLLAAQAFIFFLAGFETSSTTMSFCLYELALNTDVQERLHREIDAVLEETNGDLTYEAVQKMDYLDRTVSETLRKYPPAHSLGRKCTKSFKIPDTDIVIDEGIRVLIPVLALHRDPKYYPEPDRFDPDRFTEENKAKRPHFVYLPFGEGPRICIGMRFGLVQTKIGLAALLSRYSFKVCDKTDIPLKFEPKAALTSSVGGIWLQITNRLT